MPMYDNHHGRTTAMWTGTTIVMIGFFVGTFALTMALPWLFWIGVALVPIGAIVGKAMAMAGMGQPQKDSGHVTRPEAPADTADA
ncbi:MAG TPA: HGxxPAAW family protein [Actinomycetota bacterium]|nr:HGxxPAAW family protein [Actinomycetota bacterium]